MAISKQKIHHKSVAIVTIFGGNDMTPAGRREVARWLRRHADALIKNGSHYSNFF